MVATPAIEGRLWVSHPKLTVGVGRAVLETGHMTRPQRCAKAQTLMVVRYIKPVLPFATSWWCLTVVDLAVLLFPRCFTAMIVPFAEMVRRCNAVSTKHHHQLEMSLSVSLHTGVDACMSLLLALCWTSTQWELTLMNKSPLSGFLWGYSALFCFGQDTRCAGFSNLTYGFAPGKSKPGAGHYRPLIDMVGGMDKTDVKWETWTKTGYTPPPPLPPRPPPPPPPPLPRSWQVWKKRLEDGSVAAAFLNRGSENQTITVKLSELGSHLDSLYPRAYLLLEPAAD